MNINKIVKVSELKDSDIFIRKDAQDGIIKCVLMKDINRFIYVTLGSVEVELSLDEEVSILDLPTDIDDIRTLELVVQDDLILILTNPRVRLIVAYWCSQRNWCESVKYNDQLHQLEITLLPWISKSNRELICALIKFRWEAIVKLDTNIW